MTDDTFRIRDVADVPFFDIEDEYFVKTDLWLMSSIAIDLSTCFMAQTKV